MATMSTYSQFSYPYSAASQLLMTGSPNNVPPSSNSSASSVPSASGATSPSGGEATNSSQVVQPSPSVGENSQTSSQTPCCDTGRPIVTDPVTGQTVCSCQYDRLSASLQTGLGYGPALAAARLAAVSSAVTGVTGLHGVYSAAYPSSDQNPYPSLGMDSTFYSSLTNPYSLKDPGTGASDVTTWSAAPGLHQSAPGYYPYDPALAAYGYGASYDLAARRKNATRESTATLKAWLSEHKKNPYPTKGEKIMLAIITKMTLTQVSTWFANARRRLKKENKMTWEPKNRNDDDDDDDDCSGHSDDESKNGQPNSKKKKIDKDGDGDEKSDCDDDSRGSVSPHLNNPLNHLPPHPTHHHLMHPHHHHHHHHQPNGDVSVSVSVSNLMNNPYHHHHHHHSGAMSGYPASYHHPAGMMASSGEGMHHHAQLQPSTSPSSSSKPKIWSLADTAACKTPPPQVAGAAAAAAAHSSGGMIHHHPLVPPAANHHAWFNGPMATGASPKMPVYGRYPAAYGSYAGYSGSEGLPQTDTPPQTPPNLKMAGLGGQQQQHQQYHPYASPRMQQQQTSASLPPPPTSASAEANGEMLLSPGASRQHMAANPVNDASSSTAFRPIYRTSPNSGYPSS